MGTIVQEYGPIYGEVVNGTVQGRPNGSVYVPISNTVDLYVRDAYRYVKQHNASIIRVCTSGGAYQNANASAIAQDLASNIRMQLYSDAECTTLVAQRNASAGLFNWANADLIVVDEATLTEGETYYFRAQLMNNGVAVATSSVLTMECVV